MPIALIGMVLRIRSIAGQFASWLVKNPWVAVCLILGATAALERHEASKWHTRATTAEMALKAVPAAQARAKAAQLALNASVAAQYQAQAETSDANYKIAVADAGAAADRYIAAHRVQPAADPGGTGSADRPAQAGDPGLPDAVPADAILVSSGDVQACTGATSYAVTAHNAAIDSIVAGTAVIETPVGK